MKKSTYKITKMDCPSEEQLIRMKLANIEQVKQLNFDIAERKLEVWHEDEGELITKAIDNLDLNSNKISTEDTEEIIVQSDHAEQRKLLWWVLSINFFFFALEIITGFIANSMGLVADSLDMFADSLVYALALFAVGSAVLRKKKIARISGYFQLFLAILGLIEVIRRFSGFGEVPGFLMMIIISLLALTGNSICLYLLQRSKSEDAHMKASMIFTSNDVIINIGVIIAGGLVYLTSSKMPDLIVGICVFIIVGRGAFKILKLSR